MKIKTKLLWSFLIIVIITSVSSLFFLHRVKPITQSIKALDHQLDMVQRISTLKDTISSHTNAVQTYLLTRNRKWESTYHELSRVEGEIIKGIQSNETTTERKERIDRIIDLNNKVHDIFVQNYKMSYCYNLHLCMCGQYSFIVFNNCLLLFNITHNIGHVFR